MGRSDPYLATVALWLALASAATAFSPTPAPSSRGGGHCVWYGVCGEDPDVDMDHRKLNCLYSGPAKRAPDLDASLLAEACPHLARELADPVDGSVSLCCDTTQLQDLKRAFALPESLLGRCPACLANFRKNFCDMTCRPDQSRFVNATKVVHGPTFNGKTLEEFISGIEFQGLLCISGGSADMVQEVKYFISEDFAQSTFDSCAGVVHPSTSGSIMSLMCGRWGGTLCTARRWFEFMGSTTNGVSPFEILYEFVDEQTSQEVLGGFVAHDPETTPCNVEANVSAFAIIRFGPKVLADILGAFLARLLLHCVKAVRALSCIRPNDCGR